MRFGWFRGAGIPEYGLEFLGGHIQLSGQVEGVIFDSVADHNGYSKKEATDKVGTLLEIIKRALASGEDVLVSGFGKFVVKGKAQRRGRNPATGDAMMLKPRRVVTFKCSGKLRRKINTKRV